MTISRFITRSPSMLQLLFCMTCLNLISYSFFQICLRAPLVSDFCFAPVGFFCHSLRSHICLLSVQSKASLVAQTVKCLPALWETRVQSLSQEDSPGEGNGDPLQYSCLENSMDGGAWWATVHGAAKSQIWLRDFTFFFLFFSPL